VSDVLTPAQRTLRARVAAYARAAKYGPEVTRPAFTGRMAKLAAQVDPEGVLPDWERQRRATALLRSQMAALSLKASRARSKKKPAPVIVSPGAGQEGSGGSRRDPSAA
jgi:hypothetical protein